MYYTMYRACTRISLWASGPTLLAVKALTKEVVKLFTDNGFPFYATLRGGAPDLLQ